MAADDEEGEMAPRRQQLEHRDADQPEPLPRFLFEPRRLALQGVDRPLPEVGLDRRHRGGAMGARDVLTGQDAEQRRRPEAPEQEPSHGANARPPEGSQRQGPEEPQLNTSL